MTENNRNDDSHGIEYTKELAKLRIIQLKPDAKPFNFSLSLHDHRCVNIRFKIIKTSRFLFEIFSLFTKLEMREGLKLELMVVLMHWIMESVVRTVST